MQVRTQAVGRPRALPLAPLRDIIPICALTAREKGRASAAVKAAGLRLGMSSCFEIEPAPGGGA